MSFNRNKTLVVLNKTIAVLTPDGRVVKMSAFTGRYEWASNDTRSEIEYLVDEIHLPEPVGLSQAILVRFKAHAIVSRQEVKV